MLALTFADPADYDKIQPNDKVTIKGLESFAPGVNLTLTVKHENGSTEVNTHSLELPFCVIHFTDGSFTLTGYLACSLFQRRSNRLVQGWICPQSCTFPNPSVLLRKDTLSDCAICIQQMAKKSS